MSGQNQPSNQQQLKDYMRPYKEMLKYMYKFELWKTQDPPGRGLSEEDLLVGAKEVFGEDESKMERARQRYKPKLEGIDDVDRLIEDVRAVRQWHVEDALVAHRKRYGDDKPFEEPPPQFFRGAEENEKYFAGEAGVGHRVSLVKRNLHQKPSTQWGSTDDQRTALGVAMGYKANEKWWLFPGVLGEMGKKGATSTMHFEYCVWGSWWWRLIHVGDAYKSWSDGGRRGEFEEPRACLPPRTWGLDKPGGHTSLKALSENKRKKLVTDEQTERLALALSGRRDFEWWKSV